MSTPITLFIATVTGQQTNTRYPNKRTITNTTELKAAVAFDHVAAEYQGNMRSATSFTTSDCLVMDIDNDHTDSPVEWVTPQTLEDLLPVTEFYTATSRNHLKPKGIITARPRFHVYLPIKPVTDAAAYAGLKKELAAFRYYQGQMGKLQIERLKFSPYLCVTVLDSATVSTDGIVTFKFRDGSSQEVAIKPT